MKKLHSKIRGFTLIEMMIVVAIIAILIAVAMPSYTAYLIRSRVSEGLSMVASAQSAWTTNFNQSGSLVSATSAAIIAESGVSSKYVNSISLGTCTAGTETTCGEIIVTLNGTALGTGGTPTLVFKAVQKNSGSYVNPPSAANGSPIDWSCASTTYATSTSYGMPTPSTTATLSNIYAPSQCQ